MEAPRPARADSATSTTITLVRTDNAPRLARLWLSTNLPDLTDRLSGDAQEVVRLVAAELVANVLKHTRSNPRVTIELGDRVVIVSVTDADRRVPVMADATGGRYAAH